MPDPTCAFCGSSLKLKKSTRNGKCRACGRGIPPTRCTLDPHWQARKVTITEQPWPRQ
jgi:primosomal protein N'